MAIIRHKTMPLLSLTMMKLLLLILVLKSVLSKTVVDRSVFLDPPVTEKPILPPKLPYVGISRSIDKSDERNEKVARISHHNPHAKEIASRIDPGIKTRSINQEREDELKHTREGFKNLRREGLKNKRREGLKNKREELKQQKRVSTVEEAQAYSITGVEKPCDLTSDQKEEVIKQHRQHRLMEPANNMWQMNWDDHLADLAQGLVDTCVFKHTNLEFANGVRVGQNLAAVTSTADHSFTRMMNLFYDEKKNYDFESNTDNGVTGHYKQAVFYDSTSVGCAMKFCEKLFITPTSEIFDNAWFWACDYFPPSNSLTRPYDKGDKCSKCVVPAWDVREGYGVKCVDNACVECTLNSNDQDCKASKPCTPNADKDPGTCPFCPMYNWCEPKSVYYTWSKSNCQTSCGLCDFTPDFDF